MIILGIDPGTATTGFGVIENSKRKKRVTLKMIGFGTINTKAATNMEKRLLRLKNGLFEVIEEHRPEIMVVEKLFFSRNAKTAMTVGQARGVVMLTAAEYDLPLFEYTALEAKLELTGYGRAKKKDVEKAVKKILRTKKKIRPDDAADALAMAICHVRKQKTEVGEQKTDTR